MIFSIIYLLAFLLAFTLIIINQMHMFQLNSYKPKVHTAWVRTNLNVIIVKSILSIFAAASAILFGTVGTIIGTVILLLTALINKPVKAKKPLVYTNRVKRMLVTTAILTAVFILLLSLVLGFGNGTAVVSALFSICAPFVLLTANALNQPLEKSINNGFINEAKDMINACPDLTVIGVTGSYGKTSVKFYLNKLLSAQYNVLITPENYNTTLGVVKTIRGSLKATHEIFICEMGAKNINDIKEICDIVKPKHGIITSIGPQHLESFKTIENVVKTKFELADAVPDDGMVFLNYDNDYIYNNKINKKIVSYGIEDNNRNEYRAYDITVSVNGSEFKLKDSNGTEHIFSTKLIGKHNVCNIVAAIAVADKLGVPMDKIIMQVRRLEGVPHRLQLIKGGNALIIDDAYNSNPSGSKAALETLDTFDGFKVLVTPGMVELGEKQYECNKEFGVNAAAVCDFVALVGKKQTEPIYDGLLSAGYDEKKIFVAANLQEALGKVNTLNSCGKQKIVLLENDLPDNY